MCDAAGTDALPAVRDTKTEWKKRKPVADGDEFNEDDLSTNDDTDDDGATSDESLDSDVEAIWGGDTNRGVVDGADFAGETPDVLTVKGVTGEGKEVDYHFAPACVHHLLETRTFDLVQEAAKRKGERPVNVTASDVEELEEYYSPQFVRPRTCLMVMCVCVCVCVVCHAERCVCVRVCTVA